MTAAPIQYGSPHHHCRNCNSYHKTAQSETITTLLDSMELHQSWLKKTQLHGHWSEKPFELKKSSPQLRWTRLEYTAVAAIEIRENGERELCCKKANMHEAGFLLHISHHFNPRGGSYGISKHFFRKQVTENRNNSQTTSSLCHIIVVIV